MPENRVATPKTINTKQLDFWRGSDGDEYIERNRFEEWKLESGKAAFKKILQNLRFQSVLEVGSNIGLNLIYLSQLFGEDLDLYAVEPNTAAFHKLTSEAQLKNLKKAWNCNAFNLPLEDGSIDLVFTSGVLIHIAPQDLQRATDEIVRVSNKYVLCIEYFSHKPESIEYRGRNGLLFKRDFGAFYQDTYPELRCRDYGFLWQRDFAVFDNLTWWLFEK
jgi:pseudaminic acid biosynthesis-associated methylase